MNAYFLALRKCTDFDTRTNRTDFWMFTLFNSVFIIFTTIMDNLLHLQFAYYVGPFRILYGLFIFLPSLAITVRRLHDTDKSGWNILISLVPGIGTVYLFYLLATKGDEEDNSYLPDTNQHQNRIALHDNTRFREIILVTMICYLFVFNIFWFVIGKVYNNFYSTIWYKILGSLEMLIWGFVPIILALLIKSETKRIAMLIIGTLYCMLSYYRIIELLKLTIPAYSN